MNPISLAYAYLRHRPAGAALNGALLALGTAALALLLILSDQLDQRLRQDADAVDLVVGAKGSPMQLVLSSVFHADVPVGNIHLDDAWEVAAQQGVGNIIPLALGDGFRGFRIVGTTHDYVGKYESSLAEGTLWNEPLDAVLGAAVAVQTEMSVGDRFVGEHGIGGGGYLHEDHPYTITGVLERSGSVLDRLILTSVETVRLVHEHEEDAHHAVEERAEGVPERIDTGPLAGEYHDELTAFLVDYASPVAAVSLPRWINRSTHVQAASPAFEIRRLLRIAGFGADVIGVFALLLVAGAILGVFATLFNAFEERRFDLAMMRVLGATRLRLFWQILLEGFVLSAVGAFLGVVLAHLAVAVAGEWLWSSGQVVIEAEWAPGEVWLVAGVLVLGIVAALPSAWRASRLDIPRVLSGG